LYRFVEGEPEVFLVHPGGPFWEYKDEGSWSIPKGEFVQGENPLEAAQREFFEETGSEISGEFIELTPLKQPSGKVVYAWAVEGNIDAGSIKSNLFQWNGRRNREKSGSFQKWIGEVGLRFPRRKKVNEGPGGFS